MQSERPNILPPTSLHSAAAKPFWEGLARHELLAQSCRGCHTHFFPPAHVARCACGTTWPGCS